MQLQVGVKVLLRDTDGRFLLMYKNKLEAWDIPGGRINPDERLMPALEREVLEETGIVLAGVPRLLAAQDILVEAKGLHVVRLTYTHDTDSSRVSLSDEHQEHRWVGKEAALQMNLEPYLREVLEGYA